MKKILKILASFIVLLLAAMIVLPILFKDDIVQKVKDEANNNLNAKVNFGEFGLSLFTNFPHFSLTINDVSVEGTNEFKGVRLAKIGELKATVNLFSLFGDKIELIGFHLANADLHAKVLEDGKANWDIAKPSTDTTAVAPAEEEASALGFAINSYGFEKTNIVYEDLQGNMYAEIKNLNHEGSGDFTEDLFTLETETNIDELTYVMDNISYLNSVKTKAVVNLAMDMKNSKYTFEDNEIVLNALPLQFEGWIAMPNETDINMDMKFNSPKTDFKEILSLVPAVFKRDFESVKTSGKMALNGTVKGTSNETQIPGFDVNLMVENGTFQYPDLPKSAKNIQVKLNAKNPGGDPDQTVVDLSQFHVELGSDKVDMKMHVATPVSDPNIDGFVKANINLTNLKDVVPQEEGESMGGQLNADITMKGRMSSIDKGQYEQFNATGNFQLQGFDYTSAEMPYDVAIANMEMEVSPKAFRLSAFESKIGESDISATGSINNMLGYYFRDELLAGSFTLNSQLMDLNEFMTDEEETTEEGVGSAEGSTEESSVFQVPNNIHFSLSTAITKMLYDNLEMANVSGKVELKDGGAILDHLLMNMLGGQVDVSGSYDANNPATPIVAFEYDIKKVDIQQVYNGFETVQEMAPIAENAVGKISSQMTFNGALDQNMDPIYNTLNGKGKLQTFNVVVKNSGALGKVADKLSQPEYKNLSLNNTNISFSFENGRIKVEPFDMKVGPSMAKVNGSSGFDQSLDYVMNMEIPTGQLGNSANQALSKMAGGVGQNLNVGDKVNLDVLIGGFAADPKITTNIKSIGGNVVENVKEEVKEKIEEKKEEIKEDVKNKASEQAKKIIADAEKQAAKIKADAKSAAEKVRKEGYARADQLENEAKNPIAKKAAEKAAAKIRKESDQKADNIIKEGNTKADKVIAEAKKKAAELE